MAYTFIPPVRAIGPNTVPGPHPGNDLFRHYRPHDVGTNVFRLPGDVITETDPADGSAVTTWHGGHEHPVSAAEVALLTAAGYGDNIIEG